MDRKNSNTKAKATAKGKNSANNTTQQQKKKKSRGPKQPKGIGPRPLFLNSPQLGAGISCGFRFRKGTLPTSLIVEGRDLTATAMSASSATPATFVRSLLPISVDANVTPLCTRWGLWGNLFQKWRVRKLRATLVANMATTTVGNNYAAFFVEDNATPAATAAAIMALEGSVMGNAYSQIETVFDTGAQSLVWMETTASAESPASQQEASPGTLMLGSDGYSSALVPGKVVIDYELEFCDPR